MLTLYTIQPSCLIIIIGIALPTLQEKFSFIRNFSCTTFNWKKIVCNWYTNGTDDTLIWSPDVSLFRPHWYRCPTPTNTSCELDIIDDGIDIERQYNIILKSGGHTKHFIIQWSNYVLPDPVFGIQTNGINKSCVSLQWSHSNYIYNKTHRITLTSEKDQRKLMVELYSDNDFLEKTICNLIPYTNYTVTITCKPVVLGFWSNNARIAIITRKSVPASSSGLVNGGFSWRRASPNPTTNLTLYWQPLDQMRWNSDRIFYNIFLKSTLGFILPKGRGGFYATFEVNRNFTYNGILVAYNDIGNSTPTEVRVPPYEDSLFIEDAFAIVDDRKNFHVMWTPIEGVKTLSSIIFWCEHAFGDICKRAPKKVVVHKNMAENNNTYIIKNATDDKASYLLGVSYVTEKNHTTGFIWSDCIFWTAKEFPIKLKITTTPVKNDIFIKWRFPKCGYDRLKSLIRFYIVQVCTDESCADFEEYGSNSNSLVLRTSMKTVCVRVYPNWNNTDGKSSSTECIVIPQDTKMPVAVIIIIGLILVTLSIFGCFMVARKLRKTVKTIERPYTFDMPMVAGQSSRGSGFPLLDSSNFHCAETSDMVKDNTKERNPGEYYLLNTS